MYNVTISLLTFNANPQSALKIKDWHCNEIKSISRKLNFIQIKRNKYCAFIYTKGSVKIVLSNIKALSQIERIIHHILRKYIAKLFHSPISAYSYNLTQIVLSFHPIKKSSFILSAEKIRISCPSLEIFIHDLTFKFNESDFQFCSELCTSHYVAKIINSENSQIASLNIYSNFKIVVMLKYSIYLQKIHDCIPLFVETLQERWISQIKTKL